MEKISSRIMITFQKLNNIHYRVNCDQKTAHELSDEFSFRVDGCEFMPKYKSGQWDGNIRLFNRVTRSVYAGLIEKVKSYLDEVGKEYEDISPDQGIDIDLKDYKISNGKGEPISPRDYQVKAVRIAMKEKRSLLLSATNSGKSLMLYLMAREFMKHHHEKLIIVVPSVYLVEQLYNDFDDYSKNEEWNAEENCHKIFSGKSKTTDKRITITTWQSIQNEKRDFFSDFRFMAFDEVHGATANKLIKIAENLLNCDYRVGVTGTLKNTKANSLVLEGLFGPVHEIKKTIDLIKDGQAAEFSIISMKLNYPQNEIDQFKSNDYRQEIDYLNQSIPKQKFIEKMLSNLSTKNGVVFINKLDQFQDLRKRLSSDKIHYLSGSTPVKTRKEIIDRVEKETGHVIFATYSLFSTGISINNLHYAIFASPLKAKIKTIQSIGRLLRKNGNQKAFLFDLMDHMGGDNYAMRHAKERLKHYLDEQHKIIFKEYDL